MYFREALIIAFHSMRTAKMRTALTIFGIVMGITAVVLLSAFGAGARQKFTDTFAPLNTSVIISKTSASAGDATPTEPLTVEDAQALAAPNASTNIAEVIPLRSGIAVMRYNEREYAVNVGGTTEPYLRTRDRHLVAGRNITAEDDADRARVVLVGQRIVDNLFDGNLQSAVGADVRVGRIQVKIIGVMAEVGGTQDAFVLTPISTSRLLFAGGNWLNGLGVIATSIDAVPGAIADIQRILDQRHRISDPGQRDYTLSTPAAQLEQIDKFLRYFTIFSLAVASVALFIGALGLANMMLVTVSERTAEIGIRKAIGARSGAVMKQFLIEAMVLAGIGGLLGIGIGVGLAYAGREAVPRWWPEFGVPQVSPLIAVIAFGISLVVGLLAGVYPAYRAAKMHPIDALRY